METSMVNFPEFGSVFSGGRYENLASEFSSQKLPGVGVSLGLSRLMELAFDNQLLPTTQKSVTKALVCVYDEADRPFCNSVAMELRSAGLPTEVYYKSPKLGKQIDYADTKGIPFVIFANATGRTVEVKDLRTKEQSPIASLQEWAQSVRDA
jgi:histidyl-tRNA synthetase